MLKNQYLFQIDLEPIAAYSWKYIVKKILIYQVIENCGVKYHVVIQRMR